MNPHYYRAMCVVLTGNNNMINSWSCIKYIVVESLGPDYHGIGCYAQCEWGKRERNLKAILTISLVNCDCEFVLTWSKLMVSPMLANDAIPFSKTSNCIFWVSWKYGIVFCKLSIILTSKIWFMKERTWGKIWLDTSAYFVFHNDLLTQR